MTLSEKLNYLKEKNGFTSVYIAQLAGLPPATVHKIVSGQTKQPSSRSLAALANALHVPLPYLTDDQIDADHHIMATGGDSVNEREQRLMTQYRSLPPRGQNLVDTLMDVLRHTDTPGDGQVVTVLSYEPFALGKYGFFAHRIRLRPIQCAPRRGCAGLTFALQLPDQSVSPAYHMGALLAIDATSPTLDQLGVYLYEGEGFIRILRQKRRGLVLQAVNVDYPDVVVSHPDQLQPLGRVLGTIDQVTWRGAPMNPSEKENPGILFGLK